MARKKRNRPEEGSNAWMNTYADTITLLLCFFVLLFSFSSISESKWKEVVKSFKKAFSVYVEDGDDIDDIEDISIPDISDINSSDDLHGNTESPPDDTSNNTEKNEVDLLYERIKDYVDHYGLSSNIDLEYVAGEIKIRFSDVIFFNPNSYVLLEKGKDILSELCEILNSSIEYVKMIEIQGHTAARPTGLPPMTGTFEFSTYRATNVLRYAVDKKNIDPRKIVAIGYGQYHPVADNDTEVGREKNRRVEIIVRSNEAATDRFD